MQVSNDPVYTQYPYSGYLFDSARPLCHQDHLLWRGTGWLHYGLDSVGFTLEVLLLFSVVFVKQFCSTLFLKRSSLSVFLLHNPFHFNPFPSSTLPACRCSPGRFQTWTPAYSGIQSLYDQICLFPESTAACQPSQRFFFCQCSNERCQEKNAGRSSTKSEILFRSCRWMQCLMRPLPYKTTV